MTARLLALASISALALAASPAFAQTTPAAPPAQPGAAATPAAPAAPIDPVLAAENAAVQKALTDGEALTKAKDYDGALAAYAAGIAAAPNHLGAVYLHRFSAGLLRTKAIETYNASKRTDADKAAVSTILRQSFDESVKAHAAAVAKDKPDDAKSSASGLRDTMRIMHQLTVVDDLSETQVASARALADEWLATSPTSTDIGKFAVPMAWALFYKKQADALDFLDKIEPLAGTDATTALNYYEIVRLVEKPGNRKAKADKLLKAALAASTSDADKKILRQALGI